MMKNYYRLATEVDSTCGRVLEELKKHEFYYEHPTIRDINFIPSSEALVRKDWKYLYWPDFKREQLFDLETDPREENDLVGDTSHADRLAEMQTRFRALKADAE